MTALDLDGTLLGPDHKISDASVEYLRYLHNRGFIISIATGRSPIATAEVIHRLNLSFPQPHSEGFPAVTTNGARGIHVAIHDQTLGDGQEGKETNPMLDGRMSVKQLFHQPVSITLAKKVLNLSKRMGCVTNYYLENDIYAQIEKDWHLVATQKYTRLTGCTYIYCEDDYQTAIAKGPSSKMLILCEPQNIDTTYQQVEEALGQVAQVIRGSPPFFVEILEKEVCKGAGVEIMCEKLGVNIEECIAFGDGHNDLEAIQKAGLGVAMQNAHEQVKAVADEITEYPNSEVRNDICFSMKSALAPSKKRTQPF